MVVSFTAGWTRSASCRRCNSASKSALTRRASCATVSGLLFTIWTLMLGEK